MLTAVLGTTDSRLGIFVLGAGDEEGVPPDTSTLPRGRVVVTMTSGRASA